MPRPSISPQQAGERKEKIARAATRLFAERGFDAVHMNHIADAAGVSVGALYRSFRNKDDLILFICQIGWGLFNRELEQALSAVEGGPTQKIKGLPAQMRRFIRDNHDLAYVLAAEMHSTLWMKRAPHAGLYALREKLALLSGEAAGYKKPKVSSDTLLELIFGVLIGNMLNWDTSGAEECVATLLGKL